MSEHWRLPAGAKGGKGGGKSGSGGTGSGGVESPNTLKSKQQAKVLDLISEGPILGPASGMQSVFYDGVRVQNPDGTFNFTGVNIAWTNGSPGQAPMPGQSGVEAEHAVGVQIKTTTPATRSVVNPDVNRIRVTVAVSGLTVTDTKTGNITGSSVSFNVYLQSNGGGFLLVAQNTIVGKTTGRYQRAITFPVFGTAPWDVRIVRTTADSTKVNVSNDLFWDTYAELIDAQMRYQNSAVVGVMVDAAQFQAIPQRTYDVQGLLIQVPINYDPVSRVYTGAWNGQFKMAWSNNPAWVFYDLVTNGRYGIGNFIPANQVDKYSLYGIGQWCDGPVPDGKGGAEPRWTCNAVLNDRQEAFDLLQSIASVFRGVHFWAGGTLTAIADRPTDPVGAYTNANVIDGTFTYSGSDLRARHTQATVTWNDPQNLGQPRVTIVEDQAAIARYGIQTADVMGIGCTSEGQAIRLGKWQLYSEIYETNTVQFSVGLTGAWCRPGDIIQVADVMIGGERRGGRIVAATTTQVTIDGPVTFHDASTPYLTIARPDGTLQTVVVYVQALATPTTVLVVAPLTAAPTPGTTWVLSTGDLATQLFRVISIEEKDGGTYQISALSHDPSKWAYVEQGIQLADRDVSNIGLPTVYNLKATDYLVPLSAVSVGVMVTLSWQSTAPLFEVRYRPQNGNWTFSQTNTLSIDVPATQGLYEFSVTPLNLAGMRGPPATLTYNVIGLSAPPADVQYFRIQVVNGVAMFTWAPSKDLDVIIGGFFQLRYSPLAAGVAWNTANTVITQIPGTAATVELPYRPGTYLIKAVDISGLFSNNAATVITASPDTEHINYTRICESPDWTGVQDGTVVKFPQQWLMLTAQGGLWDDQLDPIDTWSDVDNLPIGASGPAPSLGYYYFSHSIDMGAVFPVRLSSDMLAFPYVANSVFVDDRAGDVDTWADWDAADKDAGGMALVEIRQTNDNPASPTAQWSQWGGMIAAEYTARAYQFRVRLTAPPGENVAVEQLCILADISAKQDNGADIIWTSPSMNISYNLKFYTVPSLAVAIQQGVPGDTYKITNKTITGFTIQLLNSSGAAITAARTFDWQAQGY